MTKPTSIIWFRQDLRLSDNPALTAAVAKGSVLAIYILDNDSAGDFKMGGASRWWLHHSLQSLRHALHGKLNIYQGNPADIIASLCQRHNVQNVYWNRCYEPWRIHRDQAIKNILNTHDINARSFNSTLLQEPWATLKPDGSPYKIFTPYHRKTSDVEANTATFAAPNVSRGFILDSKQCGLATLSLLPTIPWDKQFYEHWEPGETGALDTLQNFLREGLGNYQKGRDFPALKAISTLSPHLHFGEISPQQIINTLASTPDSDNKNHFKRELRWREFSYYLLYHWSTLPTKNLKPQFDTFPWQHRPKLLAQWQQGKTGYPIVDAGMRELWQTGFMHNRVRMITASFLVKNLLIDWREGAQWFWDCLVDADLASNSASWQWVAGCGTDASPYFRIFNPVTQGEKFDANGDYTKRYLPELQQLPAKYLYKPWEAPPEVLAAANVRLGDTYPIPVVDIKTSRLQALAAYEQTKTSSTINKEDCHEN